MITGVAITLGTEINDGITDSGLAQAETEYDGVKKKPVSTGELE
jgi:hypothetical protein